MQKTNIVEHKDRPLVFFPHLYNPRFRTSKEFRLELLTNLWHSYKDNQIEFPFYMDIRRDYGFGSEILTTFYQGIKKELETILQTF